MKEIILSIIVPCYNVEKYIEKAFASLISQKTYYHLEILFINDGSTDNTLLILEQLIKQTNHHNISIVLISQENSGYGKAVNIGLQEAKGKYIGIFEPDDEIPEKYYDILLQQIEKYSLEACFYDTYVEVRQGIKDNVINSYNPYYFNHFDILTEQEMAIRLALGICGICLGIYKKDFLIQNNIKLNENSRGYEDVVFIALLFAKIQRVKIIPGGGYRYTRDNINQSVQSQGGFYKILIVTEYVLEQINKDNPRYEAILGFLLVHLKTYHDKAILSKQDLLIDKIKKLAGKIINNAKLKVNHRTLRFVKSIQKELNLKCFSMEVVDNYYPMKYKDTLPLSNGLGWDFSMLYSYAYLKFLLIKNEAGVIDSLTHEIVNDILCFSNIPNSENDSEFAAFLKYFLLHIPCVYLLKKTPANYDLLLCARQMNILFDISSYMPEIGRFSLFNGIHQLKELEKISGFEIIKNYYSLLEKHNLEMRDYLYNKNIAIVGNSPCEIGTHKGIEIDSHDIVIRFNNFSTDKEYIKDYGEKTNVWALTPRLSSIMQRENVVFDYVLFADSNRKTANHRFDMLKSWIFSGIKIAQIPCIDILNKYDIRIMSMGLIVSLWILENINFKRIDLYGFSLKEQEQGVTHYFEGDPSKGKILPVHKWNEEAKILLQIKQILEEKNA